MMKVRPWLGVRIDRIADRWDRLAEALSAHWYGSLDRIADRWDRLAEALSAPWYRELDRIAGRWDRFAEATSVGWERVTRPVHARRRRHGEGKHRWFAFVEGSVHLKERFTESFIGRERLTDRVRGRRVRTARSGGAPSHRRVADRIVVVALTGIVGLASVATLYALRDTGGGGAAANTDLSGRGASSGGTVERPNEVGAAPEEQPPASDGSGTPLAASRVFENELAGYRFSYPSGWEVSGSDGITRLTEAAGDVVISFRTAPSGSIHDLSDHLVGILASRYGPLDLVARDDAETSRGEASLVLGVKATDTDGSLINLMIVAIEGPDRNRAVTVRFSADSDLLDISSSIERIVDSFTTSAVTTAA